VCLGRGLVEKNTRHPLIYHSRIRVRVCGSGEELGTGNEFGEDGYGVWGCVGSGGGVGC
jgi:hypothetical protein